MLFEIDKSKNSYIKKSKKVFYRYSMVNSIYTFLKNLQFDLGTPVS